MVRGGVVGEDEHDAEEVPLRRREARPELVEDAGAGGHRGGGHEPPVGELERPLAAPRERLDEEGELDDARPFERLGVAPAKLAPALDVERDDPHSGAALLCVPRNAPGERIGDGQAPQPRGRGGCAGGQEKEDRRERRGRGALHAGGSSPERAADDTVLAARLRRVEGDVGSTNDPVGARRGGTDGGGDADADRDLETKALGRRRFARREARKVEEGVGLDGVTEPLGHDRGARGVGVGEDREELLASPPADQVARPEGCSQDEGRAAKHLVADVVAVLVVEEGEVVDVDHDDRERRRRPQILGLARGRGRGRRNAGAAAPTPARAPLRWRAGSGCR